MTINYNDISTEEIFLKIEAMVLMLSGRPRHCGKNAFRRLNQGWILKEIDPEMALFSILTAEEEASTALIFALKQKQYPGANKLNHRNHQHKVGLMCMIKAVWKVLVDNKFPDMNILFHSNKPRIDIQIHANPTTPYSITLKNGDLKFDFHEQLMTLASNKGADNFLKYFEKEANFRNQILYASDKGIPKVSFDEKFFNSYKKRVLTLLALTIVVLQTSNPQPLADQVLQSYLIAMKRISC